MLVVGVIGIAGIKKSKLLVTLLGLLDLIFELKAISSDERGSFVNNVWMFPK